VQTCSKGNPCGWLSQPEIGKLPPLPQTPNRRFTPLNSFLPCKKNTSTLSSLNSSSLVVSFSSCYESLLFVAQAKVFQGNITVLGLWEFCVLSISFLEHTDPTFRK